MQHSNHKIIVRYGHSLIICRIVNIWEFRPVLGMTSRMWDVLWLLGCLFRHCNVTTSNIATSLEPRGQKAHHTRVWAQAPLMESAKLWRFYQKCGIFWIPMAMSVICTYVSARVGWALRDLWDSKMVSIHFKAVHKKQLPHQNLVIYLCGRALCHRWFK